MSIAKLNKDLRSANKKTAQKKTTENDRRDSATLEILKSINSSVQTLGDKIAKAKPPVVNIPERKPYSYEVKNIKRGRDGGMTGMRIDPILTETKSRKV